jgi:hypothetical protein
VCRPGASTLFQRRDSIEAGGRGDPYVEVQEIVDAVVESL